MKLLATFVLVGTIDSMDTVFATVELNTPAPTEQSSIAILPLTAFPCEIEEGDRFFVVKLDKDLDAEIICADNQ
jgi:hypothetical protein